MIYHTDKQANVRIHWMPGRFKMASGFRSVIVPDLGVAAPRESRLRMFRDVIESSNMHQQHQHKDKTMKQLNNVKPKQHHTTSFLGNKKPKVATSTWSMLEPHMWNGNHLQSNMSWDMPHRTFTCTGNPRKKNPSLL